MSFQILERECGFPDGFGLYLGSLMGDSHSCHRHNIPMLECDHCGYKPQQFRGIRKIQPVSLFGKCPLLGSEKSCPCNISCKLCNPAEEAFLMFVGEKFYTISSFIQEVTDMGLSKKIPHIPADFKLGEHIIYFAYPKCATVEKGYHPHKKKAIKEDGIFLAVKPTHLFYYVPLREKSPELIKELNDKNITPIFYEDNDHRFSKKKGKSNTRHKKLIQKIVNDNPDVEELQDQYGVEPKNINKSDDTQRQLGEFMES